MHHPDTVPEDEKIAPRTDAHAETSNAELKEIMGLELGDVWKSTGENPVTTKLLNDYNGLRLTDPTDDHPQSSRSGMWSGDVDGVYRDWYEGNIVPAKLTVDAVESDY